MIAIIVEDYAQPNKQGITATSWIGFSWSLGLINSVIPNFSPARKQQIHFHSRSSDHFIIQMKYLLVFGFSNTNKNIIKPTKTSFLGVNVNPDDPRRACSLCTFCNLDEIKQKLVIQESHLKAHFEVFCELTKNNPQLVEMET